MAVSYRPRAGENVLYANSKRVPAKAVPLTEERFAILGHELRNPLSALNYALQAWPAAKDDPQLAENLVQVMRRQVLQLTHLCNDLLDTGRIARGNLAIDREGVDVEQLIENACEEMRPYIDQCGHTLTIELNDLPLTLVGDASRLTQVFANLLHNSAKFTQRNGQLHLSLEREGDEAVLTFRDTGRGIGAHDLRHLFRSNDHPMGCSEALDGGLGIGLRLAKTIVELHGGTIRAYSKGLKQGSEFVVRLPIVADVSADETGGLSFNRIGGSDRALQLPQYRIVVVDDDRSMRLLMPRLLEKLEQSVTVADNGDTALEMILASRPDVVFLDLQMHGISGFDVARQLRRRAELDSVVLIALSGSDDAVSRKRAADAGMDHYLVKPACLTELATTLSRISGISAY